MHDYHEGLPGYSPAQVLIDGCGECEQRAQSLEHGLANLDRSNFVRAWSRAATWNRAGLPDLAKAEMPMFRVLWAVQVQLEQRGVPIGSLPAARADRAGLTGWDAEAAEREQYADVMAADLADQQRMDRAGS